MKSKCWSERPCSASSDVMQSVLVRTTTTSRPRFRERTPSNWSSGLCSSLGLRSVMGNWSWLGSDMIIDCWRQEAGNWLPGRSQSIATTGKLPGESSEVQPGLSVILPAGHLRLSQVLHLVSSQSQGVNVVLQSPVLGLLQSHGDINTCRIPIHLLS